ncbi:MAG: coproporphyrinogen III oxidase family protein [Candidatus Krumholzibacteriota bacterium]|nr:coproporphyrinogen III oxidase family protein [Candidatus Krumholzibacteriota bacterium]
MSLPLYVHVPFCRSRCGYCAFYAETAGDPGRYVAALAAELDLCAADLGQAPLPSLYVGGGTPSCLPRQALDRLLALLAPLAGPETEFTVECNPDDLDADLLARLLGAGVDRLSLGVQSLDDGELARAGRRHDGAGARAALALAAAAPLRLSADLILGLPGQTRDSWRRSLAGVLDHAPEHLSVYCLEEGEGRWGRARASGAAPGDRAPAGDAARGEAREAQLADAYLETHAVLAGRGYAAYEVSNWCRPGGECRHNLAVWEGGDYLGLGPAAHSHLRDCRLSRPASLDAWQAPLLAGRLPPLDRDARGPGERRLEALLLGLRTRRGLAAGDPALAGAGPILAQLADQDWARREGTRWRLTPAGWLRLDAILARLVS